MKIPNYNKKIKHPTYLELQEEIERLNNIINEFEEWLNAKYEEMHDIWYVKVLNKLNELKGSENNEDN